MISIITAIHNGIAINKFYEASLKKYTVNPFELIILDNASTDGSAAFFENAGHTVVRNPHNYSYPYCQNQGIKIAQGEYLFFLNNDIVVGPRWDELLIHVATKQKLDVLSACDNGNVGDAKISKTQINKKDSVQLTIPVSNTGKRNGTEVIQVYVKKMSDTSGLIKTLKGFKRVEVPAGKIADATIVLPYESFEFYDDNTLKMNVTSGDYEIWYGTSSAEKNLKMLKISIL